MEKTLLHEDIYIYVDEIFEQVTRKVGNKLTFINDATGNVVDKGILTINFSTIVNTIEISCNGVTMSMNADGGLNTEDSMIFDLRKNFYTINGVRGLFTEPFPMEDNKVNEITVETDGTIVCEYKADIPDENSTDLMFCDSVDVTENYEIMSTKNIRGITKNYKNAHGTYSWSINIIWSEDEAEKFNAASGKMRIRLIDLDGRGLESLGNCYINSIQKSSSDSGDYTLNVSGVCDKIF